MREVWNEGLDDMSSTARLNVYIPIVFGWLHIHRADQLCYVTNPLIVVHWVKANWMNTSLYSKRLLVIGGKPWDFGRLDYHDPYYQRE